MDLTQPCYDSILNIDQRLEELQKEVCLMEREYGFKEKHVNLVSSTKPKAKYQISKTLKSTTQEQTRYNNLPSVKIDPDCIKMKKTKQVPKISQKWKDVFKMKPDNTYFKEKNKIPSFGLENEDIKPSINMMDDEDFYKDYMQNYAIKVIKNEE